MCFKTSPPKWKVLEFVYISQQVDVWGQEYFHCADGQAWPVGVGMAALECQVLSDSLQSPKGRAGGQGFCCFPGLFHCTLNVGWVWRNGLDDPMNPSPDVTDIPFESHWLPPLPAKVLKRPISPRPINTVYER